MTAAMFSFETQAGWKETNVQEHTGANGTALTAPVFNFNPIKPKR